MHTSFEKNLTTELEPIKDIKFEVKDADRILVFNHGIKVNIQLGPDVLSSVLEMIESVPTPQTDIIESVVRPIPVYFGSRPFGDILVERIGISGTNEMIKLIQNSFLKDPVGAFFTLEGKEFIYINSSQILGGFPLMNNGDFFQGKAELAAVLAHELTHVKQHLSESGRKQTSKDKLFTLGFSVYGGLNGLYLSAKIFGKLLKIDDSEIRIEGKMTRREFLIKITAVAGGSFLTLIDMKLHSLLYYLFLNKDEKQANDSRLDPCITNYIEENISISSE